MSEALVQAAFSSGEWSPNLYARVDMQKYRSAAALLANFFVDYRGGASTRPGSRYILQAYQSQNPVRIISFQASLPAGYVIEIGTYGLSGGYMRFFYNGSPIVEASFAITAASQANPCVLTIPGNNFNIGDWIYVTAVVGMTQLNGRYFQVIGVAGNLVTIGNLSGVAIDSTVYNAYASGGTAARIYTIATPYISTDNLDLIKFSQSVGQMILCHPNHPAYVLSLITPTNWVLNPVVIGATIGPPGFITAASTLPGGSWTYSYRVTAIDSSGQESLPSTLVNFTAASIRTTAGSNQIFWTPVQGAVAYNVYEATISDFGSMPVGVEYGFIGTCSGTSFVDSNIGPDFTQTPPIPQNPFVGSGIDHVTVSAAGTYTTVPSVTFSGTPTIVPSAIAQLGVQGTPTITAGGIGHVVGDKVQFGNGVVLQVLTVSGGAITSWSVINPGAITSGSTPTNPVAQTASSGSGTGATMTATWGVTAVIVLGDGAGFTSVPTVIFSAGAAAATAFLTATSNGNPTCPGFVQQRMVLAGQVGAPATFYMSQPGQYFNFNISDPTIASDAVTGTLVSGTLNSIKSIVGSSAGMIILSDKAMWLVNGGSSGSAITPAAVVANPQSYIGASDVPPIVANYDILYVQAKGSAVRDAAYNIYFNIFTGTDISIQSSHLFYGYTILEWAYAEAPYYIILAVRNDGVMLSLTFLKEQDFIGWSHYITQGNYKSVCSVTEILSSQSAVDALYSVVQRTINGNSVQYIERFTERTYPNGLSSAWCVDSGLQYSGSAQLTFTGAESLAGASVTGLATDSLGNVSVLNFVMPVNGIFTLPAPPVAPGYTTVTVGLGYTCQLQTLPLDIGEPTVQGKVKKIRSVDIRVKDTLGLLIGSSFATLVPMKDLVIGNVSSALTGQQNQIVTDLVTGDARTFLDPTYTVPGQYCIQQSLPYPATVLGAFPEFVTEDRR